MPALLAIPDEVSNQTFSSDKHIVFIVVNYQN